MDPRERWQSIAPASDEVGRNRTHADSRKRRQAIPVACIQCRSGKAKCDGIRPQCTRCQSNDLACQYDVAEGVSRAERMKMLRRDTLSTKGEGLERIVNFLRTRPDDEATIVLAKLRLGDRVEDVAESLPTSASSSRSPFKPPGLPNQDSTETITSGTSYDSPSNYGDNDQFKLYRHDSTTLLTLPKGKQPAIADKVRESSELHLIFDRLDFLLPMGGSEGDSDDPDDGNTDRTLDPRLFSRGAGEEIASPASSFEGSRSRLQSPHKDKTGRSIHATHLLNRQPIVNTLRLHPNLNLQNLFGNLPFSSAVRANNHPAMIQKMQVDNLSLPTWSMMTCNTRLSPGSLKNIVLGILDDASALLQQGTPLEFVIEAHPNIAALFDPDEYERAGILSKWAASMVHSTFKKGYDFTCFASMYIMWYVMRWMISPSPETYEAMPEWLRPTPNQLFMPHVSLLDFLIWPAFRELAVQIPAMQERMEWMVDLSKTIKCDWWSAPEDALLKDEDTGPTDLCPSAKVLSALILDQFLERQERDVGMTK